MTVATGVVRWPMVGRHIESELFLGSLADPTCAAFLIHGEQGVGKTRLANECLAAAEAEGHPIGRAVASRAAATVPLGAIAHLLPAGAGEQPDPVALVAGVRRFFAEGAGDRRFVLMVDDLHCLDATSTTLVSHLLQDGLVLLLGTVRSDEPLSDSVASLAAGDRAVRVDLGALDRDRVDTLLHLALGGPIDGAAGTAVWTASRGNVLFVRELIQGALASGALVDEGGVWRLEAPLARIPRLVDLVQARVAGAGPAVRELLERVALCGSLGQGEVEATSGIGTLEDAERAGLVQIAVDGRRRTVALTHPLHADVLCGATPSTAARRLLLDAAAAVEAHGARRREDPLQVAGWRVDAGGAVDVALLLRAAGLARHAHDFVQVARLARAAAIDDTTPAASLLLGEALYQLGSFDEAELVLGAAADRNGPAELQLKLAQMRATNFFWGLLRPDDALAVNRAARTRAATPEALEELLAGEASVLMFSGRPGAALEVLDAAGPATDARARVERAIVQAPALALGGRTGEALDIAARALEEHLALGQQLAIAHPSSHVVAQVLALADAGRLAEAEELARRGYQRSLEEGVAILRLWFTINLGRCACVRGQPVVAERWCREARALAATTGFAGPRRMALSGLALSLGLQAKAAEARAVLAERDDLPPFGFVAPEAALGPAWAAAADGDLVAARRALLDAAGEGAATGHLTSEAWLLHDVARLGGAADVVARLEELAATCDGALVAARASHARAITEDDPDALEQAADGLEAIGLSLAAAEAATSASSAWRRVGRERQAAAATARAAALAASCDGVATPGLLSVDTVVPLTKREREVALLAAKGVPSKAIAERLFLSYRTVDNHLHRAYTKLGVTSRPELAAGW